MKHIVTILFIILGLSAKAQFALTMPPCGIKAITGTLSVNSGSATQLTDATLGGYWNSSTTTIATVSSSGLVTGVGVGTSTITYSLSNYCLTTSVVTVSAAITSTTWNPSDKGSAITLSGGNLTATYSAGTGMVRSVLSIANGTKRCWEITPTMAGGGTYGIDNGSGNTADYVGQQTTSYGWYAGGSEFLHNGAAVSGTTTWSYISGDTLLFALDLVANTLTVYKNGLLVGSFSITGGTNYYISGGGSGGGGSIGVLNTTSTISGVPAGSHNPPTGFQIGV